MRLINTATWKLKEFMGEVPPYAILSHCWEEEEVLFADMADLKSARLKKGFSKVQKACRQAARDKYNYIWIDSCAIDKSSSAELSEAINSMFTWYREAGICYVYLADVRNPSEFRMSRWFTRAWTLQELLAPCHRKGDFESKLIFLNRDWLPLISEVTSSQIVSEVTGIPKACFDGRRLEDASISMRMSWAAGREATRPEDIAYALFGIFNVNMPLLYGEGVVKAFHRLQEEIMKVSEDETLFAWSNANWQNAYSGALAVDPMAFSSTKHMMPFSPEDSTIPHTMTSRGLRIRMQVLSLPTRVVTEIRPTRSSANVGLNMKIAWGCLRCYLPLEPFRTVVVPLQSLGSDTYTRDHRKSLGTIPSELVPDTMNVPIRDIYIRKSTTISINNAFRRRNAFLIRTLPPKCSMARVSPKNFWHPEGRVLQGHRADVPTRSWSACLEWSSPPGPKQASDYSLSRLIILGVKTVAGSAQLEPWCHISAPCDMDYARNDFRSDPEGFPHHTFACNRPYQDSLSRYGLKITMSPLQVFGQSMFVLDITLAENASPASSRLTQISPPLERPAESSSSPEPAVVQPLLRKRRRSSNHLRTSDAVDISVGSWSKRLRTRR